MVAVRSIGRWVGVSALAGATLIGAEASAVQAPAPTVPPLTVPARVIPRQHTEEFQSADWTYQAVSPLRDESLRAAGSGWRVERTSGTTIVTRNGGERVVVPGDWALGVVTARGHRAGLSADGSTLVLANVAARDRFMVVQNKKARELRFAGTFGVDAVSADGHALYLIESKDDLGRYAVRQADLTTDTLLPGVVQNVDVNQRGPVQHGDDEDVTMRGKPLDRSVHTDGWTYTLYYGTTHTYVHALNGRTVGPSLCFDLPAAWSANAEGLRLSPTDDAMTVVQNGRTIGRLVGTRAGSIPKVEVLSRP
jgi:hypothetical protein